MTIAARAFHGWLRAEADSRGRVSCDIRIIAEALGDGSPEARATVLGWIDALILEGRLEWSGPWLIVDRPRAAQARQPRPKKRRLPTEWTPPPESTAWAEDRGLPADFIDQEARRFVRYWRGADAKGGGLKADWPATWENWLEREARSFRGLRPSGNQTLADAGREVLAQIRAQKAGDRPGTISRAEAARELIAELDAEDARKRAASRPAATLHTPESGDVGQPLPGAVPLMLAGHRE